ncbi:hypothetical protein Cme02nite_32280 [Catellatospora methionotrophica]|uniref:PQQ enzyme repeat protein n=1 Tax=Catellatospora methionotrophica TaxID=121620 RepID=A0A8J3PER7_9ACTN|nr:hypothetical protein [Catellatospora methionotrophica]GIG14896.1 hypothetical protein Cme02nite_32280 [Catellatospora methionotrophica]
MEPEIIDLGEIGDHADPGGHPRRPARHLRLLAMACALLMAASLSAAAPVRPIFEQVAVLDLTGSAAVRLDAVELVGDLVLVRGDEALSAYALDDGSLRWRLPQAAVRQRDVVSPALVPGVLVLTDDFEDGRSSVSVVDVATGAVRWSTPGSVGVVGEYALDSRIRTVSPGDHLPSEPAAMDLTVRELRTGRARWTLRGEPFAAADETRIEGWSVTPRGEFTV